MTIGAWAGPVTRREAVRLGLALAGGTLATASTRPAFATSLRQATPMTVPPGDRAEAIVAIARDIMEKQDVKAVIVRVTIDGQEVVTEALGESMTGVPATTDMHFRNGAVAFFYVATLLLRLVDQNVVTLDDPLDTWLPDLPDADQVTLRMLANLTAGYPDFVQNPKLSQELYADPFRQWTPEEQIALSLSTPRVFAPGTNWDYSHTDYVILGQALERATGTPMAQLLREQVLDSLDLRNTQSWSTATIPTPVLHAFSSERRQALGIPAGTHFSEESTFWNPSWTFAQGAIQTTNIYDMTATAVAIGEGTLLSPVAHQAQIAPTLLGFGSPLAGCPACHTLTRDYVYGLGVVISNGWLLQNPLFAGYGAVEGNYKYGNASQQIFAAIGALLAPEEAPPTPTN